MQTKRKKSKLNKLTVKKPVGDEKSKGLGLEGLSVRNVATAKISGMQPVIFTFVDLDREHPYFNLSKVGPGWFILLLDTLQKLSNMSWSSILSDDAYDAHPHDWNKTTTQFKKEKYEQFEGVQFQLKKNTGRVHGYVIGNLFYVVWLDPYHNLYDMDGFPPVKSKIKMYKNPGKSCLQIYNEDIEYLAKENQELRKENNEVMELLNKETS